VAPRLVPAGRDLKWRSRQVKGATQRDRASSASRLAERSRLEKLRQDRPPGLDEVMEGAAVLCGLGVDQPGRRRPRASIWPAAG
jgi:hypothetical protein